MSKVKVIKLTCERCGHTWIPRGNDVHICPSCKSYLWDKKKIVKS